MPEAVATQLTDALAGFGLERFRPGQEETISAVLAGQNALCILPTGGGKSLCYQLPAVVRGGLTVVISPLIALMKDQVDRLQQLGVAAECINSSLSPDEQTDRLDRVAAGEYRLVYVAPERLRSSRFLHAVERAGLGLLAVDEAHCISQWGHDFRPDYARIGRFRERMGQPQTIALTATATATVRDDIVRNLGLAAPRVVITGFARENLSFEVQTFSGNRQKDRALVELLSELDGAGLIYTATRKRCDEVAEMLRERTKRRVGVYHAGLLPDDRRAVQERFMADEFDVVVATNAFGMGIDKRDLRFVLHYNMPGTLEAYYQEAGRAGRDGLPSRCILLFAPGDRYVQEFFIEGSNPSLETIQLVYDFLRQQEADPIELTRDEVKEAIGLTVSSEAVGSSQQALEEAGALERLESRQNLASVRLDSELPTLVELLPRTAKKRRQVMRAIEHLVGDRRGERVYFHPQSLAESLELDPVNLRTTLRELCQLDVFDYCPPFRGRAVHMLIRDQDFDELPLDREGLEARRKSDFDKLDRVVRFAQSKLCRQLEFLQYFGEANPRNCGVCDNCQAGAGTRVSARTAPAPTEDASSETNASNGLELVARIALSGIARMRGRFGKTVVAQMLWGSQSQKLSKWNLDRLPTFGKLSGLKQDAVSEILDELLGCKLARQNDIERFRPVLELTETGVAVMKGEQPLPSSFSVTRETYGMIVGAGLAEAAPESRPVEREPPREAPAPAETEPCEAAEAASADDDGETKPPRGWPDYYWTWRLMQSGFSLDECAVIRRLDRATLEGHLREAAAAGLES